MRHSSLVNSYVPLSFSFSLSLDSTQLSLEEEPITSKGMTSSSSVSNVIVKEGILEKKGHSTAFFMWPK